MADAELTEKVLPTSARLLDALRLYSAWLMENTHLLFGLANDATLATSIERFWKTYGRTLDLVTTNFPIWDLEEVAELPYMLEEDAESLSFLPVNEHGNSRNNKMWNDKSAGGFKPRFSEDPTRRAAPTAEMLARIYGFLEDGLYVANDLEQSPIKIKGARVYYGNGDELEQLLMPAALEKSVEKPTSSASKAALPPKPMSYAKALASARPAPQKPLAKPVAKPKAPTTLPTSESDNAMNGRLTRMVDDLVDDDEANNPVTPPQQYTSNPTVVQANGDTSLSLRDGTPDLSQSTSFSKAAPRASGQLNPLASIWPTSPPGLNAATLSSPPQFFGHSRVNSANSVHSRASQDVHGSWSSIESAPQGTGMANPRRTSGTALPGLGGDYGQSALLFGSSGSMWSNAPAGGRKSFGSQSRDTGLNG